MDELLVHLIIIVICLPLFIYRTLDFLGKLDDLGIPIGEVILLRIWPFVNARDEEKLKKVCQKYYLQISLLAVAAFMLRLILKNL
ncbi:MAG: hypothetical protein NXI13_07865 [Proteobacteria bacterium]|nr:hypothetical protein [Pseudomonadota bacterium]